MKYKYLCSTCLDFIENELNNANKKYIYIEPIERVFIDNGFYIQLVRYID